MKRRVAGAIVVVLVFVAAGCGDTSKPLSTVEFRTQANAICNNTRERAIAIVRSAASGDRRAALEQLVASKDRQLKELAALDPPAPLQGRYKELRSTMKADRDVTAGGLVGRSPTKARADAEWDRMHRQTRLANRLGLPACE